MMRRSTQILSLCVLFLSTPLVCGAKSIFNLNLLGERVESGDVRAVAIGGGYHLVADSLGTLQFNPAMVSYTRRVTIAASQFMGTSQSESALYEERSGTLKFTAFSVAFPLFRVFSVAFQYHAERDPTGQFSVPKTSESGEEYVEEFERSGGLSSYSVVIAANITSRIKIGAGSSLESGRMTDTWRVGFPILVGQDAFSQQQRTMRGYSGKIGVVVRPFSSVSLGLTYKTRIDYDTTVDIRHTNTSVNSSYDERTVVPESWTASGAWTIASNWTIYAGGQYSDYTKFRGLAFPTERLQSQQVMSIGAEQTRGGVRFPVRFSVSYERLPYTLPAGEDVTTVAATFGTGLKLGGGRGKLDLALRIGQTGSLGVNGFEDRFVRLYIGVAGSESWRRARADGF